MTREASGSAAPAAEAATVVSLERASVTLGSTPALVEVSLSLRRGDRLMLVGPNGAGKTTLLRLLHGLLSPSAGRRMVHALEPEGRPPVGAMLFQKPFLLRLSVERNLRLALWLHGVPAAERPGRCARALERVGMSALAARAARRLSGGQQQRLALARAWALAPDVLFLDEPTASLDPGAKREVESLIDDFARDRVTLVMSTHNLGQARRLGTRVVYLEAGRVLADQAVDDFFGGGAPEPAARFLKGELPWA